MPASPRTIAVGPVMPGWGSWEWVGTFLLGQLAGHYRVSAFEPWRVPYADVVVVVKQAPPPGWVDEVARHAALVYCPIDHYGEPAEIDADAPWLRACAKVLVHCRRLQPHFAPLAPTAYVDHPLKFATPTRKTYRSDGPLLWVGVRSNLPPLVEWVNAHPLPAPLDVLTNPESPGRVPGAAELGFRADREVRVHEWTPERHLQFTREARAALDVKGDDFRSRHKPPAKAIDFVASGLPVAMNPGTSPAEHLAALGLKVPSPLDVGTWLSEWYWKETKRAGERLARELAPGRLANRFRKAAEEAFAARPGPDTTATPLPSPAVRDPQGAREADYRAARELALRGEHRAARRALAALDDERAPAQFRALVRNDLAALSALEGDGGTAEAGFRSALALDPACGPARANLSLLGTDPRAEGRPPAHAPSPPPAAAPTGAESGAERRTRVAVVSFLFNWPSTGGGNVHTAELTGFLADAGYEVKHLYARFDPWGIGRVAGTPFPAEAVPFAEAEWTAGRVVQKFRAAVDGFDPDWVVLTDSWNMKPLLADAAGGRPYVLRLQALECLCPLNNVRLLPGPGGAPSQCARHQLATPDACARCVRELEHTSGDLHRAERALAGVGTAEYRDALFRAFGGAAAVLAVNPLTAAMVEPHARDVRVVTAGMDPARFPWPFPEGRKVPPTPGRLRILFAGLTHEWMKGFHVLRAVCERLWSARRDFEVAVTDSPPTDRTAEPWARYVGWQSQGDLPAHLAGADLVVVPTVAQEALGRTAVEAMAAGRPVVASRIGGLPFTVADGATGLLCAPGSPDDLADKLAALLGDAGLRARLGAAGRRRFEEHYAWPALVERHYRPLFGPPVRAATPPAEPRRAVRGAPGGPPVLVVVSHYAARPAGPLVRLLDSMAAHPAGCDYALRVVVNRDAAESLELPARHGGVEVLYRPNAGYNIGAWEAGWRAGPEYPGYLFLQDECVVVRPGWAAAFARACGPGVGLVGECLSPDWDAPWAVLAERFRGHELREHAVGGRKAERVECYLDFFRRRGIPAGERGDHLQSLVWYAPRAVLERVGGFPGGATYGEAIAAEMGTSKKVQAAGLALAQVGPEPFTYVEHPQWLHRRVRR
jgi:glycosyltransferase involved in cell wall biosynthesis